LRRLGSLVALGITAACSTRTAAAIDPNRTISQYVHDRWGPESGFPHGPVYSIEQTEDGYLWIGTEKGLVRFDGISFQVMESAAPQQPSLSHVLGLMADRNGGLWVRLRHPAITILRYDGAIFRDAMMDFGRPQVSVSAITRARDGAPLFWVLEGEASAIVLRGNRFETVAAPANFSRSAVLALAQTSNGDLWVGTRDAGLIRLSGGRTYAVTDGLPDLKVNALVPTVNNQLWIGTDSGIARWDGRKLTRAGLPKSLDGVQALAINVDRDSNLWVGTNSKGLLRINPQGTASFEEPDQRATDAVTALFEDREGDLWVGRASGLERLRDSAFVTYSLPEGLPSDGSNPVFADASGRVWFPPVTGGLWWFKDGQHGRVTNDGLEQDVVYSIAGDDQELWIGRQRGGLTRLRWERGSIAAKTYTHFDGLAQDSVFAVYRTRDGTVWAGTLSGGATKLSGGRLSNYTIGDGLASNTVTSILETWDGAMWFATPDGLSELEKGRWRSYTSRDGLPSNDVNCLLEDSTGVLWTGTAAGLAFRGDVGFQLPVKAPPSLREQILGLAEDRFGSLWVATANHVLRVNRDRLLHGALAEGDLREYGLADGLRGVEGVKRHRSVMADSAGRIWFSLNRGISVVDPARLRSNSAPSIAHVETISADASHLRVQGAIHIPGGHRRIVFGYTGLSLSVPERVRFRYRLDSFDPGWSEPLATREAVYTNLPPGSYRFRVIACNPNGVWSGKEAAVAFDVDPLLWQTWWFRASVLVACMIAGLALYRLRLHQLTKRLNDRFEERLAERTRIAQELHDTLLQGFLSASMQVHVAADRLPPDSVAKPTLTRALQLMGHVIEEGRNAVRGLRSSNSVSLGLEYAFSTVPQELVLHGEAVDQIGFRVVVEGQPRELRPLLRDEVYRIGREALVNAFRHAKAGRIELELKYSSHRLIILVRDDGCGIDTQTLKSGRDGHWGLLGMRERADRIGARLRVWSSPAAGTEIELVVPGQVAFLNHRNSPLAWLRKRSQQRAGSREPGG
jgi:ligand-binding sensor domain-containing protein/signal transduction histidine kinase